MAPNTKEDGDLSLEEIEVVDTLLPEAKPREYTIVWPMFLAMAYWHIGGLYGLYLCFTSIKWATMIFNLCIYIHGGFGIVAGAHRLWAHRSYKATLPLQILLMILQTFSAQQTVIRWARDHRLHHKYTDTDADPHNATRGLFYSHIGWLVVKKHPDVIKTAKTIDLSDLMNNPVLQFQKKYYTYLVVLLVFVLPAAIPMYFWEETLNNTIHISFLRLVVANNIVFTVNSIAHKYGTKPYEKNISSVENSALSLFAFGEGYHNYHHIFPYDYRPSELNSNYFRFSKHFIDFFAWIGWAYDLKYVSDEMILKRVERTGDGSHPSQDFKQNGAKNIWGWGDKDMPEEDKKMLMAQIRKIKKQRVALRECRQK